MANATNIFEYELHFERDETMAEIGIIWWCWFQITAKYVCDICLTVRWAQSLEHSSDLKMWKVNQVNSQGKMVNNFDFFFI